MAPLAAPAKYWLCRRNGVGCRGSRSLGAAIRSSASFSNARQVLPQRRHGLRPAAPRRRLTRQSSGGTLARGPRTASWPPWALKRNAHLQGKRLESRSAPLGAARRVSAARRWLSYQHLSSPSLAPTATLKKPRSQQERLSAIMGVLRAPRRAPRAHSREVLPQKGQGLRLLVRGLRHHAERAESGVRWRHRGPHGGTSRNCRFAGEIAWGPSSVRLRAYLGGDGLDDPAGVIFYCPTCAEQEFGGD